MLEKETPEEQSEGGRGWKPAALRCFPSLGCFRGDSAPLSPAHSSRAQTILAKPMIRDRICAQCSSSPVLFLREMDPSRSSVVHPEKRSNQRAGNTRRMLPVRELHSRKRYRTRVPSMTLRLSLQTPPRLRSPPFSFSCS